MRPSPPHPSPSPAYPRALDRRRSDRTGSAASRLVIVSPGGRGGDEVPNRTRTRITLHNTHWHGEYSEGGAGREALAPNAPGRTVTSRASAASVQPKQPAADSRRVAEPRTRNRDSRLGPKYATRRPGGRASPGSSVPSCLRAPPQQPGAAVARHGFLDIMIWWPRAAVQEWQGRRELPALAAPAEFLRLQEGPHRQQRAEIVHAVLCCAVLCVCLCSALDGVCVHGVCVPGVCACACVCVSVSVCDTVCVCARARVWRGTAEYGVRSAWAPPWHPRRRGRELSAALGPQAEPVPRRDGLRACDRATASLPG